jgi:glycosyltransferase involved in cell wall biosynthesis
MKIAVLAPIAWRTPPRHYGPWEQIAWSTANGLAAKGHEVTLFATGDSETKAKLEYICEHGWEDDRELDPKVAECLHISNLMEQADKFDIIHNHFDFHPLTYSRLIKTPMVTTIHGFSSAKIVPVFKKYNKDNYYISISNADRHQELNYAATVYNGIETEQFSFYPEPGKYLLFFGRIHPDKGTAEAIEISRLTGQKLLIAGIIQDREYFQKKVKPFLDNENIVYLGSVGPDKRSEILGGATALLHPINFAEPFGLSVVESLCCGTPVIAFNKGSMSEIIVDGKNGFLVSNIQDALKALTKIKKISRPECRKSVLEKFSAEQMVRNYLQVYQKILA